MPRPLLPAALLALATAMTGAALALPATPAAAAAPAAPAASAAAVSAAPVINEVESNGDDTDWVELGNPGEVTLDLSGYILTDNEPDKSSHRYVLPSGSTLPAGGLLLIDQKTTTDPGFDFGLGGEDAVQLFAPDADPATAEPVAGYAWSKHAAVTYGRCPDLTGQLQDTTTSTPGKPNDCSTPTPPSTSATPWPGGSTTTALDAVDEDRGDWSGIDVEPDAGSGPGTLWVVQNGDGELYRLTSPDGGATWERAAGYRLRYPDGTGTVDTEGVTVTAAGSGAGIYVSSERDNDVKDTSRPAVLRYEPTTSGSELVATQEWNLAPDFPGLGANAGLEGITWIPDTWLTQHPVTDASTGADYDPTHYPGHGNGLFAVAVEGTAHVYLYALDNDGGFHRIADIDSGFESLADVQFDAERNQLWAVCDDACQGQIATFSVQDGSFERTAVYARPADTANDANEGFAVAPLSTCRDGKVATYYVDDANTDGHSLRTGTLDATCPGTGATTEPTDSATTPASQQAPGTSTAGPAAAATPTATSATSATSPQASAEAPEPSATHAAQGEDPASGSAAALAADADPADPAQPGDPAGPLALTGATLWGPVAAGVLLFGTGGGLLALRRRRA